MRVYVRTQGLGVVTHGASHHLCSCLYATSASFAGPVPARKWCGLLVPSYLNH